MTSPPEEITVICPRCEHRYQDWWRPSVNFDLDDFDDEYLDKCSSAVCPACGYKVHFETLVVAPQPSTVHALHPRRSTGPPEGDGCGARAPGEELLR